MLISTRGRYALRVMIDLAETGGSGYVPMKMIAQRQGISLKYLSCDATPCERRGECRTIAMWNELSHLINAYLDGITIADLMHKSDRQCPEDQEKKSVQEGT